MNHEKAYKTDPILSCTAAAIVIQFLFLSLSPLFQCCCTHDDDDESSIRCVWDITYKQFILALMCVVKIKMNVYQDFSYTNFMFRVCCAVSLALLARYVIFLCFSLHISHTSHRLLLFFFFAPQQDTLNLLKIFIAWESACSRVINTIYTSVRDLFELDYFARNAFSLHPLHILVMNARKLSKAKLESWAFHSLCHSACEWDRSFVEILSLTFERARQC